MFAPLAEEGRHHRCLAYFVHLKLVRARAGPQYVEQCSALLRLQNTNTKMHSTSNRLLSLSCPSNMYRASLKAGP